MKKKLTLLTFIILAVICGSATWARMAGDFEIPPKKVVKPAVPVQPPISTYGTSTPSSGSSHRSGDTFTDPATGMVFVWVPGGSFQMGQTSSGKRQIIAEIGQEKYNEYYSDELPRHRVTVDGFWIGKYEVTQEQWSMLMGDNPSLFKDPYDIPVNNVSWDDCHEFINELGRQRGKKFRLPTEAEWEYAARGGRVGEKYSGGNDVKRVAWCNYYDCSAVLDVGNFRANGFGLYDMSGNAWEWCADWYKDSYYMNSPVQNPQGSDSGSFRVVRGGSFNCPARDLRSARRFKGRPGLRNETLGFRLVAQDLIGL